MTSWQFLHPNHGWLECKPCDASFLHCKEGYKIRLGEPMSEEFKCEELEHNLRLIKIIRSFYPESQNRGLHISLDKIQRNCVKVGLLLESKVNNGQPEE